MENARTHVAKEVEAADHNQHIMTKLLEQSKYVILLGHTPLPGSLVTSSFVTSMLDWVGSSHSMGPLFVAKGILNAGISLA